MNLKISSLIILIILMTSSCQLENKNNKIVKTIVEKKDEIKNKTFKKKSKQKTDNEYPFYLVGENYFINGVEYIPEENYSYEEYGLATYYGPELHKKRTKNNSFNDVTKLLGRHKTLPLPSVVKITNLENGLSLIIKINDRHSDNSSVIQVSRKVAQLLRFYKSKITKVRVEIMPDPSKQLKIVSTSMSNENFNETITSAPTETVSVIDLGETDEDDNIENINTIQPIELGSEDITERHLFIEVYGFSSYDSTKKLTDGFKQNYKTTVQNDGNSYTLSIGPINNDEADKLTSTLISNGYKSTKIIIK